MAEERERAGGLPWVAIVLGAIMTLLEFSRGADALYEEPLTFILGIVAVVLGGLALVKDDRKMAKWGTGLAVFAVLSVILGAVPETT